ncbi:MAG: hypothetical protein LC791_16640 [Acidobacteria bacterium]|nr:hypothetical protein [Acidobacteriota bacterium]
MRPDRRKDYDAILTDFVAGHRGLRLGRLFGRCAAFAGRRAFARLGEGGLELKLPAAAREAAVRTGLASREQLPSVQAQWTRLHAQGPVGAAVLGPYLEIAARHAAEALGSVSAREGR